MIRARSFALDWGVRGVVLRVAAGVACQGILLFTRLWLVSELPLSGKLGDIQGRTATVVGPRPR